MNKKIKISLSVLVLLITISPIIYGYIKTKKELKQLYSCTDTIIQKRTKEIINDDFYFKIKSLEISVEKTYYTFKGEYGFETNFYLEGEVKKGNTSSLEKACDIFLRKIFNTINSEYKYPFHNVKSYKNTFYINGEQVYTQTSGSCYEEEGRAVGYLADGICWEYSNNKIILKRFTFFTLFLWVTELIIGGFIYICTGQHELPMIFRSIISCCCYSSCNINICCYRSFEWRSWIYIFTNTISFDIKK